MEPPRPFGQLPYLLDVALDELRGGHQLGGEAVLQLQLARRRAPFGPARTRAGQGRGGLRGSCARTHTHIHIPARFRTNGQVGYQIPGCLQFRLRLGGDAKVVDLLGGGKSSERRTNPHERKKRQKSMQISSGVDAYLNLEGLFWGSLGGEQGPSFHLLSSLH